MGFLSSAMLSPSSLPQLKPTAQPSEPHTRAELVILRGGSIFSTFPSLQAAKCLRFFQSVEMNRPASYRVRGVSTNETSASAAVPKRTQRRKGSGPYRLPVFRPPIGQAVFCRGPSVTLPYCVYMIDMLDEYSVYSLRCIYKSFKVKRA